MTINGGGYIFVPWSSLSASSTMLANIFSDGSQVLFRLISRSNANTQPYIITKQLSIYSSSPITIKQNSNTGFNTPINIGLGNYVYIGLQSQAQIKQGYTEGFIANGQSVSYTNCDGNGNSYWALFANLNPTSTSGYSVGNGLFDTWLGTAIPHPLGSSMPSSFFFFAEMHQGG